MGKNKKDLFIVSFIVKHKKKIKNLCQQYTLYNDNTSMNILLIDKYLCNTFFVPKIFSHDA